MNYYIRMQHVDLSYPAALFNSTTLKEEVFSALKFQKKKKHLQDVKALNDFSVYIKEGDRVGVIGHNGAGKSTLLRTIAGIYPIRNGSIKTSGEIRSIFDLAAGFDLTASGRDNIMNRGLMLGMTPDEVRATEREIIDFSGLEEFIDYPISAYSSGMLVRLAFSITTSIKGEILLVDEVLSAGDASFQKKAKERMLGVMDQAKILVIVLHDMQAIRELCNRVILLEKGHVIADGKPDEVIKQYQSLA